jgi:hypothetical protein
MEIGSLSKAMNILSHHTEGYSYEKHSAIYNEVHKKRCDFHITADDITLMMPQEKIRIYEVIESVIKDFTLKKANEYFQSNHCFINRME